MNTIGPPQIVSTSLLAAPALASFHVCQSVNVLLFRGCFVPPHCSWAFVSFFILLVTMSVQWEYDDSAHYNRNKRTVCPRLSQTLELLLDFMVILWSLLESLEHSETIHSQFSRVQCNCSAAHHTTRLDDSMSGRQLASWQAWWLPSSYCVSRLLPLAMTQAIDGQFAGQMPATSNKGSSSACWLILVVVLDSSHYTTPKPFHPWLQGMTMASHSRQWTEKPNRTTPRIFQRTWEDASGTAETIQGILEGGNLQLGHPVRWPVMPSSPKRWCLSPGSWTYRALGECNLGCSWRLVRPEQINKWVLLSMLRGRGGTFIQADMLYWQVTKPGVWIYQNIDQHLSVN